MANGEYKPISSGHVALNGGYDQDKPPVVIDVESLKYKRTEQPESVDLLRAVQTAMTGSNADLHTTALEKLRQAQSRN